MTVAGVGNGAEIMEKGGAGAENKFGSASLSKRHVCEVSTLSFAMT